MPLEKEISESDSEVSDRNLNLVPSALKMCLVFCEGRISPFELIIELLDDSNLKYWATNFTKKKTKNLM